LSANFWAQEEGSHEFFKRFPQLVHINPKTQPTTTKVQHSKNHRSPNPRHLTPKNFPPISHFSEADQKQQVKGFNGKRTFELMEPWSRNLGEQSALRGNSNVCL
jgi:hypothetical protein